MTDEEACKLFDKIIEDFQRTHSNILPEIFELLEKMETFFSQIDKPLLARAARSAIDNYIQGTESRNIYGGEI